MKKVHHYLVFLLASLLCSSQMTAQWTKTTFPIESDVVKFVAVPQASSGTYLFAGTLTHGLFLSRDSGATWNAVDGGSTGPPTRNTRIVGLAVKGGSAWESKLYVATLVEGVFVSTDRGTTWVRNTQGLPPNPYAPQAVNLEDLTVMDSTLYCATMLDGVYSSADDGAHWTFRAMSGAFVIKLFTFLNKAGEPQLLAREITRPTTNKLWRSTDRGVTWADVSSGFLNGRPSINDFAVCHDAGGGVIVLAGTWNDGNYLSQDDGASWHHASQSPGISDHEVYSLASYSGGVAPPSVFAGLWSEGVFVSKDNGATWQSFNAGLQYTAINSLFTFGDFVFAGTGGSIWRRKLSEVTSISTRSPEVPRETSLSQNYPNPFNPSTTIRYGLPNRSHVTLIVFNTLGQQVAQLVNGDMNAGYHEVQFDGRGLSGGVYFCRLRAGDFMETKRLLLLQ